MKKICGGVICLFVLLTFLGCEKEIDVNLNSIDPKIVIEGTVVKDSLAKVRITKTKDFNSNNIFELLSGANVVISDSEGNEEILMQNNEGVYTSQTLRGKEKVTYSLHVEIEGHVFTSVSTMPVEAKIDSIKMYDIPAFGYSMPMVFFFNPAGSDNYYRNVLYLNGVRMDIGTEAIDGTRTPGIEVEHLLPTFDNDREDSRKVEPGDTVLIELQSIDKGVYTFFDTLGRMSASQNNPTSNIVGGALGYFSAYSFDRMSIIAP